MARRSTTAKTKAGEHPARIYRFDTFPVGSLPEGADEGKWCQLLPKGTRYRADLPGGKAELTDEFLASMAENFAKQAARYKGDDGGFGLPVNFCHTGDSEPDNLQPISNRVAAGWIQKVELRDDGLWGLVKWTDDARKLIASDKFRYLSPEFAFDWRDSVTNERQGPTLFGAGLLNDPFFKDMPRVAAGEYTMADAPKGFKAQICDEYGLDAEASDATVLEHVKKHKASHDKLEKMKADGADGKHTPSEPDGDGDDDTTPHGDTDHDLAGKKAAAEQAEKVLMAEENKALKVRLAESEKRIAAIESDAKVREAKALCDELQGKGKFVASGRKAVEEMVTKMGAEFVRNYFKDAPPVVRMGEMGIAGEPSVDGELTKEQAQKRFDEKFDAVTKDNPKLPFSDRLKLAQAELPAEAKLLFSHKANSRSAPADA